MGAELTSYIMHCCYLSSDRKYVNVKEMCGNNLDRLEARCSSPEASLQKLSHLFLKDPVKKEIMISKHTKV